MDTVLRVQCSTAGCQHVVEYMETSEALNATYGDNEDAKAAAIFEMAWRDACSTVRSFTCFQSEFCSSDLMSNGVCMMCMM